MVHQYQLNGYNIVLDTCSGAIHVVDEVAYDIIARYPDKTADQIVEELLAKYADRPDVTEEELRACIGDVESLVKASTWPTPAISTAPTALQARASTTVSGRS